MGHLAAMAAAAVVNFRRKFIKEFCSSGQHWLQSKVAL
jgi:hypothetical protein